MTLNGLKQILATFLWWWWWWGGRFIRPLLYISKFTIYTYHKNEILHEDCRDTAQSGASTGGAFPGTGGRKKVCLHSTDWRLLKRFVVFLFGLPRSSPLLLLGCVGRSVHCSSFLPLSFLCLKACHIRNSCLVFVSVLVVFEEPSLL